MMLPAHATRQGNAVTLHLPEGHDVIEAKGDRMMPDIRPGTLVFIDRRWSRPSPPGLYLVANAIGEELYQLEVVMGSKPLLVLMTSRNERYETHEIPVSGLKIAGRVVGVLQPY